jgi:hypothetical protein
MVPYSQRQTWSMRFLLVWCAVLTMTFVTLALIGAHCAFAEPPQPAVILMPNQLPTYAHPSPSPSGPVTILPPASLPVYVHPSPSPSGPATVLVPGSLPIFVYPGVAP